MLGTFGDKEHPMPVRRHSYIGDSKPRQSPPFFRGLSVAILALSMGGCASIGLPFGDFNRNQTTAANTRGSTVLVSANGAAAVDPSDWEAVRRAVATAPAEADSGRLNWTNPETGSTGAVSVLASAYSNSGAVCRPFATTVNDARGIRRYRGEACQRSDGLWHLYTVTPDDATLS
jgi:surface antigen